MNTPRQILTTARALLVRDGWQQRDEGPADPEVHAPRCALGAVDAAAYNADEQPHMASHKALVKAIPIDDAKKASYDHHLIVDYNDGDARTEDEILAWFDRAISSTR